MKVWHITDQRMNVNRCCKAWFHDKYNMSGFKRQFAKKNILGCQKNIFLCLTSLKSVYLACGENFRTNEGFSHNRSTYERKKALQSCFSWQTKFVLFWMWIFSKTHFWQPTKHLLCATSIVSLKKRFIISFVSVCFKISVQMKVFSYKRSRFKQKQALQSFFSWQT